MGRVDIHSMRRAQIIEAAECLVARKGWAGTTFADICKEADISNGVLTYHFKDKDEILYAMLEQAGSEVHKRLEDAPLTFSEQLDKLVCFTEKVTKEQRNLGLLSLHFLSLATHRPEFAQKMKEIQSQAFQELRASVEQAMEEGVIERANPDAVATVINMTLMGVSLSSLVFDQPIPNKELLAEISRLLQCYLGMEEKHTFTRPDKASCEPTE